MPVIGGGIGSTLGTTGVNWRKLDISEKINNLDPTDTPVFEFLGEKSAMSQEHAWQTRTLRTRGVNAMFAGADFTYSNVSPPARIVNITQILEDGVQISRSLSKEQAYGANPNIMRDQLDLRMVEHRNDLEWNLINSTFLIGATATAAKMTGLRASITTNATDALAVSMTETIFVDIMAQVWETSGVRPDVALVGSKLQNIANLFSANGATKWIDTTTREITNQVLMYNSSFGSVQFALCRDLTNTALATNAIEMILFNRQWNHKAWFDKTFLEKSRADSDGEGMVMISELTFQYDNQLSSAKWIGNA